MPLPSASRFAPWLLIALLALPLTARAADDFAQQLAVATAYRQQGNLTLAIAALVALRDQATDPRQKALAGGELGAALLQARRHNEAEAPLRAAYAFFEGAERARYAVDLGNWAAARKRPEARQLFDEAQRLAGDDQVLALTAALNAAKLTPTAQRGTVLAALAPRVDKLPVERQARLRLNLGNQARGLGAEQRRLAYEQLESARKLTEGGQDWRLRLEIHDALAQLYEEQGRLTEALVLTERALTIAKQATGIQVGDLLIPLHWRQGRIAASHGREEEALAAYRTAVEQIESIRQDIPIEYEDNRSSFRTTLEPIYLGLADLLLRRSERQAGEARTAGLKQARAVVELIKQSEMQDYLGDRCAVVADSAVAATALPAGTAVLYPVIFPDRLELLLETPSGMVRRTSAVSGDKLRAVSQEFAHRLRSAPDAELPQAPQLYDWLVRPLAADLRGTGTLVVVPDGPLRLIPFGALHDGQRYLIESTAVATAPGLTLVQTALAQDSRPASLIAGLSEPGPVVDKLTGLRLDSILQGGAGSSRSLKGIKTRALPEDFAKRQAKEALRLPGVKTEVEALARQLDSRPLLDDGFTLAEFSASVGSGRYDVVHIASHGVFGGSGDESFILAYDELLTMDRLQQLLRSEQLRKRPIRLLTLSACETAEGDERAPLGIAGAALKARAETALGTLWPVEDTAATRLMNRFYGGLVMERLSRAEALRRAQIDLLGQADYRHPFFWAPFIVVGNWN